MFEFILNGKKVSSEENVKLLHFLRDEQGIISIKNGCDEGACGACTLLIDGVPTKACVQKLERVAGKTVTTIEGFSNRDKEEIGRASCRERV